MPQTLAGSEKESLMRLDRIERDEEVLVDIINCENQPELNATSLACRTIDVSENGMKVVSELAIPVRTRLGLRLDLSSMVYRLEGEVRWSKDDGMNYIGLLLDTQSQDIVCWNRMFQMDL